MSDEQSKPKFGIVDAASDDPFDLARLRLPQDFLAESPVKRLLTTAPDWLRFVPNSFAVSCRTTKAFVSWPGVKPSTEIPSGVSFSCSRCFAVAERFA